MKETEIHLKLSSHKLDNLRKSLMEIGFQNHGVVRQHDMIFNEDCFSDGVKVRIRVEGDKAELTCKSKTDYNTGLQNRKEININIDITEVDKYKTLLELLGYKVFFQALKFRQKYTRDGIEVMFDKWPIIDELVEIEGEENAIEKFASEIIGEADRKTYTYKEHIENKIKETGKTFEELKKEFELQHNFELINMEKMFMD